MAIEPASSCCCFVPTCCGLRGGILAYAVLQLVSGFMYVSYFFGSIAMPLLERAQRFTLGQMDGNAPPDSFYTILATAALYLLGAAALLGTAITGIAASNNVDRVMALDAAVIRRAVWYWNLNLGLFVYYAASSLLSAIAASVTIVSSSRFEQRVAVAAVALYWAAFAVGVSIQMYFLYVVWSYKRILELARDGKLEGPFVVKGVSFAKGAPQGGYPGAAPGAAPQYGGGGYPPA
eukprot:CAMPEP_0177614808 /NCGR_PEP_ID=MMETSP0419_2-20121207/22985_1 /TAXON_ID=582737 /ORGANISM="Tetraselmis sp., Strain GSL018" /LENGTH=234 /DNA_ID=CAMNT_0019112155 /DNA_START=153 /DNA_END=854 /DNA_ORIENTATION=+